MLYKYNWSQWPCAAVVCQYLAPEGVAATLVSNVIGRQLNFVGVSVVRFGKYSVNRPFLVQAILNRVDSYIQFSSPNRKTLFLTEVFNIPIRLNVLRLLKTCSPAAVLFAIVSIPVNAIQGVLWSRSLSHVLKKPLKRLPLLADLYAASSVIAISVRVRILASLSHCVPSLIQFGPVPSVSLSKLSAVTTARLYVLAKKMLPQHNLSVAAGTLAQPGLSIDWFNNCEPGKYLSDHESMYSQKQAKGY